jgi:chemotaxis protein MotA
MSDKVINSERSDAASSVAFRQSGRIGPMDVATILGSLLCGGLLLSAIVLGGNLGVFLDAPSLLIVFGGTLSATLMMESLENFLGALRVAQAALTGKRRSPSLTMQRLLELSVVARGEGVLALESEEVSDPFMAKGVRLAVEGLAREEIRDTLMVELVAMRERHVRGQKMFRFMAATAPSMGMIGTLVGLVGMLSKLADPSSIGPSMAVALLTTLYGAVLSFMVFGPLAEKLERKTADETASMTMIVEGIDGIVKGHNVTVLKDRLEGRLPPRERAEAA